MTVSPDRVHVVAEIATAVHVLSRHCLGVIVLWDSEGLVEGGVLLDAIMTRELLVALAIPERLNELHVGVIVIRDGRIERAAAPISWAEVIERAAELAASLAIALDEDTGEVRIADGTGRVDIIGRDELVGALSGDACLLTPAPVHHIPCGVVIAAAWYTAGDEHERRRAKSRQQDRHEDRHSPFPNPSASREDRSASGARLRDFVP